MPNLRYNTYDFRRKFLVYCVLKEYYSGHFWADSENWKDIPSKLTETRYQEENHLFSEGMRMIVKPDKDALYDFNRLFLGPGRLLAPPYESSYRNAEGVVMQRETMNVRRFYATVGLSVVNQNSEPDDFIALELEFMCYLLFKTLFHLRDDTEEARRYQNIYLGFLEEHLGKWVANHCEEILRHSTSDFCKGMALITKGFIQHELKCKEEIL